MTSPVRFVGGLDSDRCVASNTAHMEVAQQIADALCDSLAVIVFGESGSGKTTAMLLAAVAAASTNPLQTPFALYTEMRNVTDQLEEIEALSKLPKTSCSLPVRAGRRVHPLEGVQWKHTCRCPSCERDQKAARLLVAICNAVRTSETVVQAYHAVVVLDELGSYPGFVRAVCALGQPFRTALAAHFKLVRVSIVMGGTGCETSGMSSGSLPEVFRMVHVTTNLWPALVKSNFLEPFDALMAPPDKGKPDVRSVSAKLAHDLSSNARAAALLATELKTTYYSVPAGDARNYKLLFSMAALRAAFRYKKLNALMRLTLEEHRLLVLSAGAASHFLQCEGELVPRSDAKLSPAMHSIVMVDRAVVKELATGERQMTLDAKFCGRRFEVSAAQVAMLKLLMDTATRDVPWGGFELSMADFMLFDAGEGQARRHHQQGRWRYSQIDRYCSATNWLCWVARGCQGIACRLDTATVLQAGSGLQAPAPLPNDRASPHGTSPKGPNDVALCCSWKGSAG